MTSEFWREVLVSLRY